MSTPEEIAEVYAADITRQTHAVFSKRGIMPFLNRLEGMYVFDMYEEAFKVREVLNAIDKSDEEFTDGE